MTPYGKVAQTAIAAASLLADHYQAAGSPRLNSREIARQRHLSQPLVAKVLATLSQAGIVHGSPGPGGGYSLARPPELIALVEIVALFERQGDALGCPFGDGWCGTGPQCPLHSQLERLRRETTEFLTSTSLSVFRNSRPADGAGKSS